MKATHPAAARAAQHTIIVPNPYNTLDTFFRRYSISTAQEVLRQLAHSAINKKQRRNKTYRLMRFAKNLGKILDAAYGIHTTDTFTNGPQSPGQQQVAIQREQRENSNQASWQNENAQHANNCNPSTTHANPERTQNEVALRIRFSKAPRLIDRVATDPMGVIREVFDWLFIEDLRDDLLPKWIQVAITNEGSIYAEADDRGQLMVFYDYLVPLLEALFLVSGSDKLRKKYNAGEQVKLLTSYQRENPGQVITTFCQRFDRQYVLRELWDLLDAGIKKQDDYPEGFCAIWALTGYDYLRCLTEAAYKIAW